MEAEGQGRLEAAQAPRAQCVEGAARLCGFRDQRRSRGAVREVRKSGRHAQGAQRRLDRRPLFLSAAFWSTLILVLAGLGLSALNARWTEANFDDQLGVYLKALVANVAIPNDESKEAAPCRGRAAVRARVLRLVLADHPPRRESAGHPGVEVAVRHPASPARRSRRRPRRRSAAATLSGRAAMSSNDSSARSTPAMRGAISFRSPPTPTKSRGRSEASSGRWPRPFSPWRSRSSARRRLPCASA